MLRVVLTWDVGSLRVAEGSVCCRCCSSAAALLLLLQAGAKLDQQSWHESGSWSALSLAARNSSPKFRQQKEHEIAVLPTGDTKASAQPIFTLAADTGTKKDRWTQVIDILLEAGSKVRSLDGRQTSDQQFYFISALTVAGGLEGLCRTDPAYDCLLGGLLRSCESTAGWRGRL